MTEKKDIDSKNNNNDQNEEKINSSEERPELSKKRVLVPTILAIGMLIAGIVTAIHSTFFQSTDDAFVEGRLISVAPRVAGPVVNLLVDDNYDVKQGQLLLEIDPNDYETKLHSTEAKLAEAKAKLKVSQKEVEVGSSDLSQSYEDITSTKSKLDFAQKDYKRYSDMHRAGIASKQEYDNSKTHLTVARANYKGANDKSKALKSALESHQAKTEAVSAEIQRLEAEVEQAKLDLSYTKIYAPQSGKVSARSVEKGNYVQVGQPLMQIVPEKVWVIANFKEIQLTNMKAGQPVKIKIDTYPVKNSKDI